MEKIGNVKLVCIDADDTLWENETLFREGEARWAGILGEWGTLESLSAELYKVESKNMEDLGYGVKAFIISLMETAVKVSGGKVSGQQMGSILEVARDLLHNPATPFLGVVDTLSELSSRYPLALVTKGDMLDQEHKIRRSGLRKYFRWVEIISEKGEREYRDLFSDIGVAPEDAVMVGNSFKSDVAPVLRLGGWAVHIPFHVLWEHEKTDEFDHPRLRRLENFTQLLDIL